MLIWHYTNWPTVVIIQINMFDAESEVKKSDNKDNQTKNKDIV